MDCELSWKRRKREGERGGVVLASLDEDPAAFLECKSD